MLWLKRDATKSYWNGKPLTNVFPNDITFRFRENYIKKTLTGIKKKLKIISIQERQIVKESTRNFTGVEWDGDNNAEEESKEFLKQVDDPVGILDKNVQSFCLAGACNCNSPYSTDKWTRTYICFFPRPVQITLCSN